MTARRAAGVVVALMVSLIVPMATPLAASAGCQAPPGPTKRIAISSVVSSRVPTQLHSSYLKGPGTITRTTSGSASYHVNMSATVSAEAGIIFAKASASAGVEVGTSYETSDSWSYSKNVPANRTARMTMFHETRIFTATKTFWSAPECTFRTAWSARINAPLKADVNVWDLEYL